MRALGRQREERRPIPRGRAREASPPGVARILALQRTVGNQATTRALQRTLVGGASNLALQRVIWSLDADHINAVKLLAEESKSFFQWQAETNGPFGNTGLAQDNATAITLWGHTTGAETLAGYTPQQLVQKLLDYGLRLSQHTTLNLIACAPNATQSSSVRTYAQAVQKVLGSLDPQLNRAVQVRTLPMVKEGFESVLWRYEGSKRTAFITYPVGGFGAVRAASRIHGGNPDIFFAKLKEHGFGVTEVSFSHLIASLAPVVEVQEYKGGRRDEKNQLLIPNVYGEK